jgi:CheY-like chemotaxis protein
MRKVRRKPRIFIVEDSDAYRVLMGRMLEQRGFLILTFSNGLEALEMIAYVVPDLILSDIEMPIIDGFTLHDKMKELYPNVIVPFQYISSTVEKSIIEKADTLSVEKMVRKPAQADELSTILKKAINKLAAA